jgi:hypothetical protein
LNYKITVNALLVIARCKILTNIMPPHVKMSIKHDKGELFLKCTDTVDNAIFFVI